MRRLPSGSVHLGDLRSHTTGCGNPPYGASATAAENEDAVFAPGARSDVLDIARTTAKIRTVQSELVVGPVTDLGSRSNDTLITSKVKARFVEAQKFQINHVKVVTERGTVYLLGVVRHDEGDAAADIARTTSGVQRVVKVFEYTS